MRTKPRKCRKRCINENNLGWHVEGCPNHPMGPDYRQEKDSNV